MNYFKKHKFLVFLSIVIGLVIALSTRASLFVFTPDLRYSRIMGTHRPPIQEFDTTHLNKRIFGLSGFPFTAYSHCGMFVHGTSVSPSCRDTSRIEELSILLNTLFWALIVLIPFLFFSERYHKKPKNL